MPSTLCSEGIVASNFETKDFAGQSDGAADLLGSFKFALSRSCLSKLGGRLEEVAWVGGLHDEMEVGFLIDDGQVKESSFRY